MDPVIKLPAALIIILAVVSQPPDMFLPFALYGVLVALLVLLSKIPVVFVLKRILLVMPFVLFAAVFYPISVKITDKSTSLSLYHPAVLKGIAILIKAILSVTVLVVLVSSERFHQLLAAMRRMKMPSVVCITSALMYRYIFILADESMKTTQARQSRTPGKLNQNRLKVLGNQMAVVFLRSWERSITIYNSMLSKGFTGDFPSAGQEKLKAGQLAAFITLVLFLVYIRFMEFIHELVTKSSVTTF